MVVIEIPMTAIDLSEFNVRKNLAEGQHDSSVSDLADSIARRGLLSPITVYRKDGDNYGLIAGQRRFLACRSLNWPTISAIVRETISAEDATAISLVENVHRADMSPSDKAVAFKTLLDRLGDLQAVARETGVGVQTIRKYVTLLSLAPELKERLAAGEAKNTEALAQLAQRLTDSEQQLEVWDRIEGFTQTVQLRIIKQLSPSLDNLEELVSQALQGAFDMVQIRACPYDCPTIPDDAKEEVAAIILSRGITLRRPPK
jgi:ParB family chromosome partitioning protein